MTMLRSVLRPAALQARSPIMTTMTPARRYSTNPAQHSHVEPKAPGKTPSFFSRISAEVTPLIFFVGCLLTIAGGAGVHHLMKDQDIRLKHGPAFVDEYDEKLQKVIKKA